MTHKARIAQTSMDNDSMSVNSCAENDLKKQTAEAFHAERLGCKSYASLLNLIYGKNQAQVDVFRRRRKARPVRPVPNIAMLAGSGLCLTGVGTPVTGEIILSAEGDPESEPESEAVAVLWSEESF